MLSLADVISDYGDPLAEARRCRRHCALFDFSFVHRVRVSGRAALPVIEQFQPRRLDNLSTGRIAYSVRNDARGRVRSDLTLWRFAENVFEIMSGCQQDVADLQALQSGDFSVEDLSEASAILAVQGPDTLLQLAALMDVDTLRRLAYFEFTQTEICGIPCLVGRLGYSGEAGFEFLVEQGHKNRLWDMLSGRFQPAGFAAIDILRIEAGFFLFTQECRVSPTLGELGLASLFEQGDSEPEIRLVAFKAESKKPRDLTLWQPDRKLDSRPGEGQIRVTSACFSPHFNAVIGLGFVPANDDCSSPVDPTAEFQNVKLCPLPLYDPHKQRPRSAWNALLR